MEAGGKAPQQGGRFPKEKGSGSLLLRNIIAQRSSEHYHKTRTHFFSDDISVAHSYSGTYDNGVPEPYTMEEALSEYLIDSDYSEGYEVRDYEGYLHYEFETAEDALAYINENLEDFQIRDGGMYETYLKMEDPYEVDFGGTYWNGEGINSDTGEEFDIGMTTNDVARLAMTKALMVQLYGM